MTTLRDPFWRAVLCVCVLLALLGVVGTWDREDAEDQEALYCHMVHLHRQNPSQGWPDYDGDYAKRCIKGRVRSQR